MITQEPQNASRPVGTEDADRPVITVCNNNFFSGDSLEIKEDLNISRGRKPHNAAWRGKNSGISAASEEEQ